MLIKFNGSIAWECERPTLSGLEYEEFHVCLKAAHSIWSFCHDRLLFPSLAGRSAAQHSCTQRRVAEFCGHMVHSSAFLPLSVSAFHFLLPNQFPFISSFFVFLVSFFWTRSLRGEDHGNPAKQGLMNAGVSHTHTHTHARVCECASHLHSLITHVRTQTTNTWWSGTETPTSRLGSFVRYIIIDSRISTAFESSQTNTKYLFSGALY